MSAKEVTALQDMLLENSGNGFETETQDPRMLFGSVPQRRTHIGTRRMSL